MDELGQWTRIEHQGAGAHSLKRRRTESRSASSSALRTGKTSVS
jgi:hypothetical protein